MSSIEQAYIRGASLRLFPCGAEQSRDWIQRRLSDMRTVFVDKSAADAVLEHEDPLIYDYMSLGMPEDPGDLSFGISRVYPGCIGAEYYMTKGHYHRISDTAEVYYGLEGCGCILIENKDGDTRLLELSPGLLAYVPKGYAHRAVNTGKSVLSFLFVFRADAGHDYATIENLGFKTLVTADNGSIELTANPKRRT